MSMYIYENRLNSFTSKKKKWPHTDKDYRATPETLARAGFYYFPAPRSPDNVICFLCHKSMEGWDPTDEPNIEHLNHSPECAWAICYCMTKKFANKELPFSWDEDQLPTSKRMEELRAKTFGNWWPHDGKKGWVGTAKKMAKAGFICASSVHTPDNVMCAYCEVSLGDWEQKDDPMKEHRKRCPSCPFFDKPPLKTKKQKDAEKTVAKRTRRQKAAQSFVGKIEEEEMEALDRMVDHLTLDEPSNHSSEQIIGSTSINVFDDAIIENNCEDCEIVTNDKESREQTSMQRKAGGKTNMAIDTDEVKSLDLRSIQSMDSGNEDIIVINDDDDNLHGSSVLRYNNEGKEIVIIEDDENQAIDLPIFQRDSEIKENRQLDIHDTCRQGTFHSQQNAVEKKGNRTETSVEKDDEHEMRLGAEKDDTNRLKFGVENEEVIEDFNYELLGIIDDECDDSLAGVGSANDECGDLLAGVESANDECKVLSNIEDETYISNELLCIEGKMVSDTHIGIANDGKKMNDSFDESSTDKRRPANDIHNDIATKDSSNVLLILDNGKSENDIHIDITNVEGTSDVSFVDKRNSVNDIHRDSASAERMSFNLSFIDKRDSVNDAHHGIADVEKTSQDSSNEPSINKIKSITDVHSNTAGVEKNNDLFDESLVDQRKSVIDIIVNGEKKISESMVDEGKLVNDIENEVLTVKIKSTDCANNRQLTAENSTVGRKSSELEKSDSMMLDNFENQFELSDVTEKYIFSWEKVMNNQADERTPFKHKAINSTQSMYSREASRITADDICHEETNNYLLKKSISPRTSRELKMEDLFEKDSAFGSTTDYTAIVDMDNNRQSEIANRIFKENDDAAILRVTDLSIHSSSSDSGKRNLQKPPTSPTLFSLPYAARSPEFSKTEVELNHLSFNHVVPTTPVKQSRSGVITVEDYLRNITEEQNKRLIMKTSQMIEELLEVKKKARNAIMSIPVI